MNSTPRGRLRNPCVWVRRWPQCRSTRSSHKPVAITTPIPEARSALLAAIEDTCEGTLLRAPQGEGGFGYDPIFVPVEFAGDAAKTFAALDAATPENVHPAHDGLVLEYPL